MTVNREALIAALEAKRTEIINSFNEKNQQKADDIKEIDDYVKTLVDVRKEITAMLEAGTATVTAALYGNGEAYVVPTDPGVKLPKMPKLSNRLTQLLRRREILRAFKIELDQKTAPYDAALQLLRMSVDENVGVPAAEYQRLLAGSPVDGINKRSDLADRFYNAYGRDGSERELYQYAQDIGWKYR